MPSPNGISSPRSTQSGNVRSTARMHRVAEQVFGVALGVGAVDAAEHPADMRVEEPAQRASEPDGVVGVGAVGVTGPVGEAVMLSVAGDPFDHGALDRG